MTNLQLMDFGNSIPTMTVEVQRTPDGTTNLVQILTDVCYQAGLVDGQFDAVSNVPTTPFPGFAIVANTSAREVVGELQKVFPIDAAESRLQDHLQLAECARTQIVDRDDLAAHVGHRPAAGVAKRSRSRRTMICRSAST